MEWSCLCSQQKTINIAQPRPLAEFTLLSIMCPHIVTAFFTYPSSLLFCFGPEEIKSPHCWNSWTSESGGVKTDACHFIRILLVSRAPASSWKYIWWTPTNRKISTFTFSSSRDHLQKKTWRNVNFTIVSIHQHQFTFEERYEGMKWEKGRVQIGDNEIDTTNTHQLRVY